MQDLRVKGNSEEGGLRRASEAVGWWGKNAAFVLNKWNDVFLAQKKKKEQKSTYL